MKKKKSKANTFKIDIWFGTKQHHSFRGKLQKGVIIQGRDTLNINLVKEEEGPVLIDSYSIYTDTPVRIKPKTITKAHLKGKI